jgi:hypothetical protein
VSFAGLLTHSLEIWHPTFDEGDIDDRGQPAVDYAMAAAVAGLVQPRRIREAELLSQAGVVTADHVIFMAPVALSERDRIDRLVTGGRESYEIVGIRRYEFGSVPHLEVDAKRFTADSSLPEDEEGS